MSIIVNECQPELAFLAQQSSSMQPPIDDETRDLGKMLLQRMQQTCKSVIQVWMMNIYFKHSWRQQNVHESAKYYLYVLVPHTIGTKRQ